MNAFNEIHAAFGSVCDNFMRCRTVRRLQQGELEVRHYAQVMRQIFHQARDNPQLQALATAYFRGPQRFAAASFYRHAISEIGHDELALNDYAACGGVVQGVRLENPHPATRALTAFAFQQITCGNPVAYLGYLFFLEFLPTSQGPGLMQALRAAGVPDNAFTFLQDHVTVDEGHNKAMERYCQLLITKPADLDAVIYAMRATGWLYAQMVDAAAAMADEPVSFGVSHEELASYGPIDLGR